ncbi:Thiamine monophosphate synthase [hydrothermal vent metagenome]|uniref:Thiamine monophosphate synthase n=1 Tax=hydrothermal vent metagenome TaxID=652676 RepID=A0A1W1EJ54_9ZZZZ
MIKYAITTPKYFHLELLKDISIKANMVLFRDKTTTNYPEKALEFLNEAKKYNFDKILLHRDIDLAHKLNCNDIHLTSTQIDEISKAKRLDMFVIVSTHSKEEALKAQENGANMITYSPIFDTPNKGKPVGLESLIELRNSISIPIIALGGIVTDTHIKLLEENKIFGFASIRYFI